MTDPQTGARPGTTAPVADPFTTSALRGLFGGRAADRVHLPGDPGYDGARVAWNLAVDQRPAGVVSVASPEEVGEVVRTAALAGLRVAPQSTGHNAGPLAARGLDDVVLLRTGRLDTVTYEETTHVVRVEGGCVWEPVVDVAAKYGRAVLHGSSPDVGVAGYTLGGGMGWYARKLGLATNSLVAVEIVVGDGTLVRADAETNRELFWAVRGGGGSFGVVTAMEFRTFDIETAYAGMLMWDLADMEPVLREWTAWAPGAPDEITTSFRAMRFPPLPEIPELLRGRSVAIVDGAVLGSDERAAELLGGLRALRPQVDTFARVPAPALTRIHMDPEGGAPAVGRTATLRSMPDAAVDAFLGAAGPDADTHLLIAELRQLGGALGRPAEGGGVLSHLDGDFVAFGLGMAPTPELAALAEVETSAFVETLEPFATGRTYLNFAETAGETRAAYTEQAWLQLKGIRSAVDPYGVFAANHPVPRLYEAGRPTA
ncbi:FAD/FMN-containing dehydrogenase [Nocardioides terrae]|uniref:FAD/FMN-containing dehydrogenase n=1 Tax=Nocardioides terrae TaxID=574651 RepID=A0A1I1DIE1_9ACTN|nr:FAD-binding oxidoreductase [Nocardioides terrae]SFB72293.1 FAD/FMN-containing dehydrogenase [Nocardioides terrae]